MPQYRNITDETLFVDTGTGTLARVAPDEVFTLSESDERYVQTGESGERALFAPVTTTKKATTAGKDAE